jgi:hypothetical protein
VYPPLGNRLVPARKDSIMYYQKVLMILENIPYLSVWLNVCVDFSCMSIKVPNGTLTGKPFSFLHSGPHFRNLLTTKIK